MIRTTFVAFCFLSLLACVKPTEYSNVPTLEFIGFSKQSLLQGTSGEDTVTMVLYFTDGDGDFGTEAKLTTPNIFIKDLRTNKQLSSFKAPFVPLEGAGNGISGRIFVKLLSTCCVFPENTGIPPCEKGTQFAMNELSMEVHIQDRAGNISNKVTTPALDLLCK